MDREECLNVVGFFLGEFLVWNFYFLVVFFCEVYFLELVIFLLFNRFGESQNWVNRIYGG